ncbi:RNA 2',3'-cyclic phosphodiesterase [Candidatus Solincola sp.]|nr:RNA 2',3'-cyclic phosphodiesterase [Actinomycetota bacterium]MDI7252449.1 RNA 2',3'-cyclic phosphodiesterase [Actinomycetota bacterium]
MGKKAEEGERIRLFVALDLPEEVRERIVTAARKHAGLLPQARWVRKENLHLTLKFIGEYPGRKVEKLVTIVEGETAKKEPFTASLRGCGGFPSPGRARVIWVGMEKGEKEAAALAAELDAGLAKAGVKRETRPFRGHLTLARLRNPADCSSWLASLEEDLAGLEEMDFRVEDITLYRSILSAEGPTYVPLRRFELGR